jgi:hypothetical protein
MIWVYIAVHRSISKSGAAAKQAEHRALKSRSTACLDFVQLPSDINQQTGGFAGNEHAAQRIPNGASWLAQLLPWQISLGALIRLKRSGSHS